MKIARQVLSIINESRADRYLQMFKPMLSLLNPEHLDKHDPEESARSDVSFAIQRTKREDRIVWYLRHIIFLELLDYITIHGKGQRYEWIRSEDIPRAKEMLEKLAVRMGYSSAEEAYSEVPHRSNIDQFFYHYLSLHIPGIDNFVFTNQPYRQVDDVFDGLEQEWKTSRKGFIPQEAVGNVEILVEFEDGWQWVNLNENGCRAEADAMGHCSTGAHDGDINFSLREPVISQGKQGWKPHLTFIWNSENHFLNEMKGRFNKKPTKEYHSRIIKLLQHPKVEGIMRPHLGYAMQEDFEITDLEKGIMNRLVGEKPDLLPIGPQMKRWNLSDHMFECYMKYQKVLNIPEYKRLPSDDPRYEYYLIDPKKDYRDIITFLYDQPFPRGEQGMFILGLGGVDGKLRMGLSERSEFFKAVYNKYKDNVHALLKDDDPDTQYLGKGSEIYRLIVPNKTGYSNMNDLYDAMLSVFHEADFMYHPMEGSKEALEQWLEEHMFSDPNGSSFCPLVSVEQLGKALTVEDPEEGWEFDLRLSLRPPIQVAPPEVDYSRLADQLAQYIESMPDSRFKKVWSGVQK